MFNSKIIKNKLLISNGFLKKYCSLYFDKTIISAHQQYKISTDPKNIGVNIKYWDNGNVTETFFNLNYNEVHSMFLSYIRKDKINKICKLIKN